MDVHQFDALTRTLGVGKSRRALVKILGGLAIGGEIFERGTGIVEGKKKKNNGKKKKKACKDCNENCCNGKCVDTLTDRNNCGACGNVCVPGQYCSGGECIPCESPKSVCPVGDADYCANLQTDNQNCGSCGTVCKKDPLTPQRDLICVAGACTCTGTFCPSGRCCPAGYLCNRDDGCCPEGGDYCGGGQCCPRGFACGGDCGSPCCPR